MAEDRRACETRYRERQDLLEEVGKAALAWRSAEMHHSAIILGIREGNREEASDTARHQEASLRIAIDKFNKVK
jgi:hypothetical protein